MIGKTISHYKILEALGEGSMGLVYKAEDVRLKRIVALKFLHTDAVGSEEDKQRFIREAQTAAALDHPCICTVYGIEETEDKIFISMGYVDGVDLRELVSSGSMDIDEALSIAFQIGRGLRAAHAKGIVHRDIKCSNVMVTHDGRVRITDFGIARMRGAKDISTSTRGVGTPAYMSPEQAKGEDVVDHRTDIWSLGVCLYEMLTGRLPFGGEFGAAIVYSILNEDPAAASDLRPDLPPGVDALLKKTMAKNPDERHQTMSEFLDDLESLESEAGGRSPSDSWRGVPPQQSIAVLPFQDLSPGKDQEYFCDGVAEEIMNALIQIEGLRVAARTSSFVFKDRTEDIRIIGRKLRVNNLLEGSVRKAGDTLRITVQLTDVAGGHPLWSESFDRELKDVFAIQDEIAENVVQTLKVELSARDTRILAKSATKDYAAYDFYLRGRQFYRQTHRKGINYALEMYEHAIAKDPNYTLAYAGTADCYSYLFSFFDDDPANLEKAVALSEKALELDPELADGHISRGRAYYHSRQFSEAEKEFEAAIRLNPDHPGAYEAYARNCYSWGDLEKAARLFAVASKKDPGNFDSPLLLAQTYRGLNQPDKVTEPLERGVEIVRKFVELNPDHARGQYMFAIGLANLGEKESAFEAINRALSIDVDDPMISYGAACVYALTGRTDEAMTHLEGAMSFGCFHRDWIEKDSDLDALRDHPRYKALLERLT